MFSEPWMESEDPMGRMLVDRDGRVMVDLQGSDVSEDEQPDLLRRIRDAVNAFAGVSAEGVSRIASKWVIPIIFDAEPSPAEKVELRAAIRLAVEVVLFAAALPRADADSNVTAQEQPWRLRRLALIAALNQAHLYVAKDFAAAATAAQMRDSAEELLRQTEKIVEGLRLLIYSAALDAGKDVAASVAGKGRAE